MSKAEPIDSASAGETLASPPLSYHPLFGDVPDAIALQCKDGVTFRLRPSTLRDASDFFGDLLSLPQSADASAIDRVILIDEDSKTMEPILLMISAKDFKPVQSMDEMEAIYFAAEKYDFRTALAMIRLALPLVFVPRSLSCLEWHLEDTVRAYLLAYRAGWSDMIVKCATALLSYDISDPSISRHLCKLDSAHLLELMHLRDARKRAFIEKLGPSGFESTAHPWLTLRLRLIDEIFKNPSGYFLTDGSFERWWEAESARASADVHGYHWASTVERLKGIVPNLPGPSVTRPSLS